MTPRILGIVGSPRKGGNTEILTEHLLNGAEEMGTETELVSLSDLNLNYCRSCHHCLETGVCAISDDIEPLKEKLLRSDGIVLASSTQAQTISGNMKVFIDRLLLHVFKQSLQGKYVASISVGGFYGMNKVTKYLNDTAWAMGANKVGSITARSWEKGDILKEGQVLTRANKLGKDLVTAIRTKKKYPLQTFFRKTGPLKLFRKFILMYPERMPIAYNHWKEKGWL